MIVEPKVRGFICTTAHPAGCRENIRRQADYARSVPKINGPKKVLVIGASTGYGLASRISLAFASGAATIGIIFDRNGTESRTGSAGWYNTAAFESLAAEEGLYAKSINGDAYSSAIKEKTIELIKRDLGKVDMVIYSIAAPKRTMDSGEVYSSVLKAVDSEYTNKTIDLRTNKVVLATVPTATAEEIFSTVKVMGGEDWKDWICALKNADAIEDGAVTVAYSYIGPELTYPMYLHGTIGKAKEHLYNTAGEITSECGVKAYFSVNKALVTQSSAAIPIVPLYIAILYKIMKGKGTHEGCIEQMCRLYGELLFSGRAPVLDEMGRLRPDNLEMHPDVQREVLELWEKADDDNIRSMADIDGYWEDFYNMFGFGLPGIDYETDVDINVPVPSIEE